MNQDAPTPTNSILPDAQMMDTAAELPVLDRDGKSHPFRDIYQGSSVGQNAMFFLIRHFFCPVGAPIKQTLPLCPTRNAN